MHNTSYRAFVRILARQDFIPIGRICPVDFNRIPMISGISDAGDGAIETLTGDSADLSVSKAIDTIVNAFHGVNPPIALVVRFIR